MVGGIQVGLGRAVAVFLIGLLLVASGAPCTAAAPVIAPSAASFDPCHQTQAPAPQCAQIACKTFAVPAETAACPPPSAAFVQFHSVVKKAAGRLVRPPLPPPRASMI
ncbi:MAG TPA: hypothetical protein VH331_06310 [Allosphingosinicella sp.]|jgi:hypothetical protein|nr:hypothetical protein [Allosphingosinicella sp.]